MYQVRSCRGNPLLSCASPFEIRILLATTSGFQVTHLTTALIMLARNPSSHQPTPTASRGYPAPSTYQDPPKPPLKAEIPTSTTMKHQVSNLHSQIIHPAKQAQAAKLAVSTATPKNGRRPLNSTKALASPGASSKTPTTSTTTPSPGSRNTKTPLPALRCSSKASPAKPSTISTPGPRTALSLQSPTSSAPPNSPSTRPTRPETARGCRSKSSMRSRKERRIKVLRPDDQLRRNRRLWRPCHALPFAAWHAGRMAQRSLRRVRLYVFGPRASACPSISFRPWTRGGNVFTEHSDHNSQILFIEQWLAAKGYNVTTDQMVPWRREHMSTLMSAFDFDNPDYSLPDLARRARFRTPTRWGSMMARSYCESLYAVQRPPVPYGAAVHQRSGLLGVRLQVGPRRADEGRYLTFELGGYALTNPGGDDFTATKSSSGHSDVRQQWVLHALDPDDAGDTFYISSAKDGRYIGVIRVCEPCDWGGDLYYWVCGGTGVSACGRRMGIM